MVQPTVFVGAVAAAAVTALLSRYLMPSTDEKDATRQYKGPLRICVYGSSSIKTPQSYIDSARALGKAIADAGYTCVNGGGKTGVMGAVNQAVRAAGGRSLGVIHSMWINEEQSDELDEVIVADGHYGLHSRKELLMRNSDALIAMPGGKGFESACRFAL